MYIDRIYRPAIGAILDLNQHYMKPKQRLKKNMETHVLMEMVMFSFEFPYSMQLLSGVTA